MTTQDGLPAAISTAPKVGRPARTATFADWAFQTIRVFRVALVITYIHLVYFGVISIFAGVPAFTVTGEESWTPFWGSLLATFGAFAAVTAISERWEKIELWASAGCSVMLIGYILTINFLGFVAGDLARQAVGAALFGLLILPGTRFVWLALQSGKKKIAAA